MRYEDFKLPSTFAQEHMYYSDGIGIQDSIDFRIERQSFRNNLLVYVEEGTFYVEQNGFHKLRTGDALVMRLSERHKYYSSQSDVAIVLWMHFGYKGEESLLSYIEEEVGLPYQPDAASAKEALKACIHASKTDESQREYVYSEMIYKCLLNCCQQINRNKVMSEKTSKSVFDVLVTAYIQKHLNSKPVLNDFAEACGFSKFHFIRLFKQYYGCTPIDYIYRRKIEYSKAQLSYTGDPIGLIAEKLGFESQSHYARVFKKHVGITPSQHRKSK